MLTATVTGLAGLAERVNGQIIASVNRQYAAQVQEMFFDLLEVSPQWSGNFASNWRLSVGVPEANYVEVLKATPWYQLERPQQAGDEDAIEVAGIRADFTDFSYTDTVYFVNGSALEFTETTVTGPDGKERNLRPENLMSPPQLILSYLASKYGASG
jgi:hypothetical protein